MKKLACLTLLSLIVVAPAQAQGDDEICDDGAASNCRIAYAQVDLAAGIIALKLCGRYDSPEIPPALAWAKKRELKWEGEYFFYTTYYFTQVMHQMDPEDWKTYQAKLDKLLLGKQKKDGSWPFPPRSHHRATQAGPNYATAFSNLILATRYKLLPIYQR